MSEDKDLYKGFKEAYQTALNADQASNWALRFERLCPFAGKKYAADAGSYIDFLDQKSNGAKNETGKERNESRQPDTPKFAWLKQFDGEKAGSEVSLDEAHKRRDRLCEAISGVQFDLQLDWRFLTGSGNAHPLENSLTWHPTLGVPYLPASSFKGLLRAFLQHWQGADAKQAESLFGEVEKAGQLQFFDVLPLEPVMLKADVMTPHYGEWYVSGNDPTKAQQSSTIPAPWHNPVPIPFLVAECPVTLRAMVALRPARNDQAISLDWNQFETLLNDAFAVAGAGAKTASGYGRMTLDKGWRVRQQARADQKKQLDEQRQQQLREAEEIARREKQKQDELLDKQAREEEKAAIAAMSKEARAQKLLQQIMKKSNGAAIAGYLDGRKFKFDREKWGVSEDDMKQAFHTDPKMMAMIKQWQNGKKAEKSAYEKFKPPKKS